MRINVHTTTEMSSFQSHTNVHPMAPKIQVDLEKQTQIMVQKYNKSAKQLDQRISDGGRNFVNKRILS